MFTFCFHYADGTNLSFGHITSVEIDESDGTKNVKSDEILNYNFYISRILFLKSDAGNYSVLCDEVRAIEIIKEN